ncbi:unnamed protein product, partial [Meganyctiphanes norvegica]|uniref:EF-hand domain-containing protein n=1 Tax=Meganyctiphanes norvegica TaxID=48144 RepID=A0AAV2SG35_MEGNR
MVKNFTDEQLADFKSAFETFDEDGDGRITPEEVETVMKSLGIEIKSKEQVLDMIRQVDTNENGTLDLQEFTVMLSTNMKEEETLGIMKEAFSEFDHDGDGFIKAEELKKVLENLGEVATDERVNEMIQEVDANGDGRISYEEFTKMIK